MAKSAALVVVRRKKQVIFECPFDDVSCLTIEASGVALSTVVIEECARQIGLLSDAPMRTVRRPLFLSEARAAAHYWQAFACLVPSSFGFTRRHHREADDVVNKALNYGYALLLSRVWLAVHRSGLEPTLGLLHTGRRRSAGLVFDLMEPFRQPVVDKAVLGLIGRGAKLELNEKQDLTLRTRALLQRAIARRLGPARKGTAPGLLHDIQRETLAFRQALSRGTPYRPYRMTW